MAEVLIFETKEEGSQLVADHIAQAVRAQPAFTLGVATGSTPVPLYQALAEHAQAGLDFSQVTAFALDEYVGLPEGHPESYVQVVDRQVTKGLGLDPARVHVPDGSLDGVKTAGERFEAKLTAHGGVDLQILGIGATGHLGFNEPGSSFGSRTRVKTLTQVTRSNNARFFDSIDQVPYHCVTQGLGTIGEAGHLVLFAFGQGKAKAVAAAVEGPVTASLPGSAIQFHPHATVILDEAAASELRHRDYGDWAQANKPAWQGI